MAAPGPSAQRVLLCLQAAPLLLCSCRARHSCHEAVRAMALLDCDQLFRRLRGKQDNKVGEPAGRTGGLAFGSPVSGAGVGARGAGSRAAAAGGAARPTCLDKPRSPQLHQLAGQRDRQPAMGRRPVPPGRWVVAPPPASRSTARGRWCRAAVQPLFSICRRSALTAPPRTPPGPLCPMASSSASPAPASTAAWGCTSAL